MARPGPSVSFAAVALSVLVCTGAFTGAVLGIGCALDRAWIVSLAADRLADGRDTEFATDGSVLGILIRNLSVALLLFSGIATAGVMTAVAIGVVSLGIATTGALVAEAQGWPETIEQLSSYAAFEALGLIVAGAAGLLPLVNIAIPLRDRTFSTRDSSFARYVAALPFALAMLSVAVLLLAAGAVVESLAIAQ